MKKQFSTPYLIASFFYSASVITILGIMFLRIPAFKWLPQIVPFSLAAAIGMAITQWGHIALYMKKNTDTKRLKDILGLQTKLPVKQYLIWVPALTLITGALFVLTQPISALLREQVFFRMPDMLGSDLNTYPQSAVWVAFSCNLILYLFYCQSAKRCFSEAFYCRAWNGWAKPQCL